jgi:lysophospholipase L1-like esterase
MVVRLLLLVAAAVCTGLAGCASSPGTVDFRYVALGASDAVGIGAVPLRRGYVFRIRDELRSRGHEVELANLGIPVGEIDDIARIARLAPAMQPQLITLWTGANDLIDGDDPEEFEDTLAELLEDLRDASEAIIVIGDLPDLSRVPRFVDRPSPAVTPARVRAFNAAIMRQADEFDVAVATLSEPDMFDEITSSIDGFHPNNEGHRMIAEAFLAVILDELGER